MDVRCEKCGTEYELDDARVTEAGVTVKCTSCGHLFRVKRVREGATQIRPRPVSAQPLPFGGNLPENAAVTVEAQLWMLRAPNGDLDRFRDLQTLQHWIVQRKVTRDHQISRTGETWKRLGDIAELVSFFLVVDQAEAALRGADSKYKATIQGPPHPVPTAPVQGKKTTTAPLGVGITPTPPAFNPPKASPGGTSAPPSPFAAAPLPTLGTEPTLMMPPGQTPAAVTPPANAAPAATPAAVKPPVPLAPPPAPPSPPAPRPQTQASASAPAAALKHVDGETRSGPIGGLQGAPVVEPAWASATGSIERARQQLQARPSEPMPPMTVRNQDISRPLDADDEDLLPRRSRAPVIVLGALLLGSGVAAAVYFGFTRSRGSSSAQVATPASPVTAPPAPAPNPGAVFDAAAAPTPVVESPAQQAYELGIRKFYEDTDEAWIEAEKALEQAQVADPEQKARVLAAMALLNSSISQALLDEAEGLPSAEKRVAEQKRAESSRRRVRAETFARDAIGADPRSTDAMVALADARRLGGASSAEVEKYLVGADPNPEVPYVRGMLRLRDKKVEEARSFLQAVADSYKLRTGNEHLRARYRLGLVALAEKRPADAQAQAAAILAVQPDHSRAKALAARAQGGAAGAPTPAGGPAPGGGGPAEPSGYDALVARGNKLAENDRCSEALRYFARAYDAKPGVEALMGQGYCFMDMQRYNDALSKFRAALAMSPKNGDAIMGLADAFREQGKLAEAGEQYQRYLDAHPSGPHASRARKWARELLPRGPTGPDKPPDKPPSELKPNPEAPPEKPPEKPPETPAPAPTPAPGGN